MKPKLSTNTINLTYIALCSALIAVGSFLKVPSFAIPFTLQTFFIYFSVFFIGPMRALVSIAVYLALGAFGLPVFSGFSGGLQVILGATGGYLLGFLLIPPVFMLIKPTNYLKTAAASLLSLTLCYIFGSLWYAFLYLNGGTSIGSVLLGCVVPFIIPDIVKISLAFFISKKLKSKLKS